MRRKLVKIGLVGLVVFATTCLLLSLITRNVLIPSITLASLAIISAIAAYIPPKGWPFPVCLVIIGSVFFAGLFLSSSAFSAVPQPGGSIVLPFVATALAMAGLTLSGYRRAQRKPLVGER